jgi:nicotinamidase-related amidase
MRDTAPSIIEEWGSVTPPPPPVIRPVTLDPAKTALLLMDFLRNVCTPANRPRAAAALPALQAFLARARGCGLVIIHTSTSKGDEGGGDLVDVLAPLPGEKVYRAHFDKFHGNDLESVLRGRGIDAVIATGTSANGCLLGTTMGAVLRGFRAVVPVDAMPAATPYQEQFVAWQIANGPVLRDGAVLTRLSAIRFTGEAA